MNELWPGRSALAALCGAELHCTAPRGLCAACFTPTRQSHPAYPALPCSSIYNNSMRGGLPLEWSTLSSVKTM
jgi:hypothetical protein